METTVETFGANTREAAEGWEGLRAPEEQGLECHAEARTLYWKAKDLEGARRCLETGIALAIGSGRPELAEAMLFDLASFCWPGWGECEISIGEEELATGEWAAGEHLRLVEELQLGPRAEANAWFLIGAFHLARGKDVPARAAFALMEEQCGRIPELVWLARGFTGVALRNEPTIRRAAERLREIGGDGMVFADQLETAARVFGRPQDDLSRIAA